MYKALVLSVERSARYLASLSESLLRASHGSQKRAHKTTLLFGVIARECELRVAHAAPLQRYVQLSRFNTAL